MHTRVVRYRAVFGHLTSVTMPQKFSSVEASNEVIEQLVYYAFLSRFGHFAIAVSLKFSLPLTIKKKKKIKNSYALHCQTVLEYMLKVMEVSCNFETTGNFTEISVRT
jgi:hypothetical protein